MEASTNSLDIEFLQQSDTVIDFTWTQTGDTCRVTRDEEMIYTGTENSLKDENLQRGELYTYTIERLNADDQVVEKIKMQTSTENHVENFINRLQQIAITTILTKSKIALAWGDIEGIEEFEIYRDGEPIATVDKNQFTDRNAEMDQAYTYWIHGKRPLEKSEESFKTEKSAVARVFGLMNVKSSPEQAAEEEFWITKKVGSRNQLLAEKEQAKTELAYPVWHFRYTTFLPQELLPSPNLLSLNRYFAGDGRDFDPESKHYRTQVNFSLEMTKGGAVLEYEKDIGTSIAYDWRKKFRKADVASSEGIVLEKVKEDPHKVSISLKHTVGNPLTTSPNIDYEISATFYRDGYYDIIGIHDQSPNHEVYLRTSKKDEWEQIHEAESKGLSWMSDAIASQYWRTSTFE
ncbi:DUF3238 domain-containing protein [Planococcus sp. N028]|uniref:DUF3238 domain-containing protein n=1 Tax=Planococcus shixiaomingii TaxID=3058393 RepID=A0ABT8N5T4_9BACL|nr:MULTISPECIES: DUF3238 domain-containing protein [unclassified Planococcus (in: firmicutes)]MDN7243094.1 DUF3238 domain-containing protein [Planococcus sp. N028]WKA55041.1 DUF3238 domain-containing protein [Planococcus sp. N022]